MEYNGFRIPSQKQHGKNKNKKHQHQHQQQQKNRNMSEYQIEKVPFESIKSPKEFFEKYIAPRKPVVLVGVLPEEEWKGNRWTNDYLRRVCGKETVLQVEKIPDNATASYVSKVVFGKGAKVPMTLDEFLTCLEKKDDRYYLTTQVISINKETGQPSKLFTAPVEQLAAAGDFAIRPKIFGNLIPHQLNMWMGNNRSGSSTGLHHDYHDNLYILLRGRKRFTLYSPDAAYNLCTYGKIEKVHSSGVINYKSSIQTSADGAPLWLIKNLRKDQAEVLLSEREAELNNAMKDPSKSKNKKLITELQEKVQEAESELERLLDDLLDDELENGEDAGDDEDDDFDNFKDDFDEIEEEEDDFRDEVNEEEEEDDDEKKKKKEKEKEPENPLNFSQLDISLPPEVVVKNFPNFRKATKSVCYLEAGEMLFLPAGWFHEVTSYGDSIDPTKGHLAFNYWLHPPDTKSFESPYTSDTWPTLWNRGLLHPLSSSESQSSENSKINSKTKHTSAADDDLSSSSKPTKKKLKV